MDPSASTWTCDICGGDILAPNRGLVVWRSKETPQGYRDHDFKVVHKMFSDEEHPYRCDPGPPYSASLDITEFLGDDGLAMMLGFLSNGPLKGGGGCQILVEDMDDFIDLVRRTQTPHYEAARLNFGTEHTREWLSDANEYYPYLPDTLKRIASQTLGH